MGTGSIPPPNPLAYEGQVVVPYIIREFAPTTSNNKFPVPTIWVWPSAKKIWLLVNLALGIATWVPLSGGTAPLLEIAVPNPPSPVVPDGTGLLTFTSTGGTVTITGSTNSINFDVTGGGTVIELVHTDSGDVTPASNAITLTGTNGITTSGSGSTASVNLTVPVIVAHGGTGDTSLTAHNVLIGEGTNPIAFAAPTSTSGIALVSTGTTTDPAFGTVTVPGGGTGATSFTAHTVLLGEGSSAIGMAGPGANNSIFMGVTSSDPIFTTTGTPYVTGISFDAGSNTLSAYKGIKLFSPLPTVNGSTPGTTTYTLQGGTYTRVGALVYIQLDIAWSAATGTGDLVIGNLPYTIGGAGNRSPEGTVRTDTMTWPIGASYLIALGVDASKTAFIEGQIPSSGPSRMQMQNTGSISMTMCYQTQDAA